MRGHRSHICGALSTITNRPAPDLAALSDRRPSLNHHAVVVLGSHAHRTQAGRGRRIAVEAP